MSLRRPSLVFLSAKGRAPRNPCFGNAILSSSASASIAAPQVAIVAPHQYRYLVTSSSASKKQRVPLTLYRQLLRWCDDTEVGIPLSIYVPPFGIQPPQVDGLALRALAESANNNSSDIGVEDSTARVKPSMFPPNTVIQSHHLTCPIRNSADARSFFRAIFRLNAGQINPEARKQHIAMAFEALKSLNELNEALDDLKRTRNSRMDRENVRFRVGQGRFGLHVAKRLSARGRHNMMWLIKLVTCVHLSFSCISPNQSGKAQSGIMARRHRRVGEN
jgi:hypothetical protein